METTFTYSTGTASFVAFDELALTHRLHDEGWWSDFTDELIEVNNGNMMSVSLHTDGIYEVRVIDKPLDNPGAISCYIRCISGALSLGPGEGVPSDGMGVAELRACTLLNVPPGNYVVSLAQIGPNKLAVSILPTDHEAINAFEWPQEL